MHVRHILSIPQENENSTSFTIIHEKHLTVTDTVKDEKVTGEALDSADFAKVNDIWSGLFEINDDIIGWITVPGTTIDYPVMQTVNNVDYLNLDFYKNYSVFGTPFIDSAVTFSPKSRNTVLYGHSVNSTEHMGQLHRYLDQEFYEENKVITFNTLYEDRVYEVISVCLVMTTGEDIIDYTRTSFFQPDSLMEYIERMISLSHITGDTSFSSNDYFLTIQTCTSIQENSKLVVLAKEIIW